MVLLRGNYVFLLDRSMLLALYVSDERMTVALLVSDEGMMILRYFRH